MMPLWSGLGNALHDRETDRDVEIQVEQWLVNYKELQ